MSKLFYTIGETAEILGENVSLVRYWSGYFEKFLKTSRTAKGDRRFMPEDVETFKQIHYLVKEKGLTLDGAAKQLAADRASVDKRVRALDSLKSIREQLAEIRKSL
mgnify:FL=1